MLKTSCLLLEQRFASAFRRIVEGQRRVCQPSPRRVPAGPPNGPLAAVAVVGLIVVALTSIRLAEVVAAPTALSATHRRLAPISQYSF